MSESAGIDYGRGLANVDSKNGIHFGAISMHSLGEVWYENSEPKYPDPACPSCFTEFSVDVGDLYSEDLDLCICPSCDCQFTEDAAYADEAIGLYVENDEYVMEYSETLNCVFVIKSPYYTKCRYCSPCAPGAGDLDSPDDEYGIEAYCPGPEWFDDEPPFPIYPVSERMVV